MALVLSVNQIEPVISSRIIVSAPRHGNRIRGSFSPLRACFFRGFWEFDSAVGAPHGRDRGRGPLLPDVFEDAVELIKAVVTDNDLARAFFRVLNAHFGADLLGHLDFEAAYISVT